jgi:hypothetical protein
MSSSPTEPVFPRPLRGFCRVIRLRDHSVYWLGGGPYARTKTPIDITSIDKSAGRYLPYRPYQPGLGIEKALAE